MDFVIREIGSLVLSLAFGGAPVAVLIVLIALLNRRDRRQARLLSLAARQLTGEEVRGAITIEAHCPCWRGAGWSGWTWAGSTAGSPGRSSSGSVRPCCRWSVSQSRARPTRRTPWNGWRHAAFSECGRRSRIECPVTPGDAGPASPSGTPIGVRRVRRVRGSDPSVE